jgi:hypothetical protein
MNYVYYFYATVSILQNRIMQLSQTIKYPPTDVGESEV